MVEGKRNFTETTAFTAAIWALSIYKTASLKEKKTGLFTPLEPFKMKRVTNNTTRALSLGRKLQLVEDLASERLCKNESDGNFQKRAPVSEWACDDTESELSFTFRLSSAADLSLSLYAVSHHAESFLFVGTFGGWSLINP